MNKGGFIMGEELQKILENIEELSGYTEDDEILDRIDDLKDDLYNENVENITDTLDYLEEYFNSNRIDDPTINSIITEIREYASNLE